MNQDVNSPDFEKAAYREMAPAWTTMDDVCVGLRRLIEQANLYLPQYPSESRKSYDARKSMALFFNAPDRTLAALVGLVFRREPTLGKDVPPQIAAAEGWAENIDQCGTHWTVWAREVFEVALKLGHAAIYVDMPPKLPAGSSRRQAAGRRPYVATYTAPQIVNWTEDVAGGQVRLARAILKEEVTRPKGLYGEEDVTRYRVLYPGYWQLYEKVLEEGQPPRMDLISEGETNLPFIPLHPVYGRKTGFFTSRPPLLEIADISIAHMRKYADYSVYLHLCRPLNVFKRRDRTRKISEMSAFGYVDLLPDEDAKVVEPTGAPLQMVRQDLEDLEDWISRLGTSLLAKKGGPARTATEEILEHVREDSDLAVAARSLKDGIEAAFGSMMAYQDPAGMPSGGSVELGTEMADLQLDANQIRVLHEMTQGATPVLAIETLHAILQRAGKLPADFESAKELERLQVQSDALGRNLLDQFNRGQ